MSAFIGIIVITVANVITWLISNLYIGGWVFFIIFLIGSLPYETIAVTDKKKAMMYCIGLIIGAIASIAVLYVVSLTSNDFLSTRLPLNYLIYCDAFILFLFIGTILGKKKKS